MCIEFSNLFLEAVSITCMTYTHCCGYSAKTPDDGKRNCPKHVEFYSKNKFEKLVHLVGFIIRIYHDARSSECQIILYVWGAADQRGPSRRGVCDALYTPLGNKLIKLFK
jgi:hypothetical protein